ncbi:hypothetical protein RR48_04768 [Papilio machaon]|uniref:Uncharacterized protein n=1 Tax=Papilio machaon TaxID=76193 RepID=A0A0N1IHR8_PAPMA|nr:hypothetical protein RR48_04768 [Papilio machaon]
MIVFEQCVLPAMTYGTEMWTLTAGKIRRLKVTQRAMERAGKVLEWRSRTCRCSEGRPPAKWTDDLVKVADGTEPGIAAIDGGGLRSAVDKHRLILIVMEAGALCSDLHKYLHDRCVSVP